MFSATPCTWHKPAENTLSPSYSPSCRSEGPTGSVAGAFCDRVQRKRTRLYGEDARPNETPWTRGMAVPQ